MNRHTALLVCLAFLALSIGAVVFYYARIPEVMPTHWDMAGRVNGYMPKLWGASIPSIVIAADCAFLFVLPMISPNNFRLDQSLSSFNLVAVAVSALLFVVGLVVLQAAAGIPVHMQTVVPISLGVFLIVVGNYMGKLRKNFFIGVRTPWTLASDEVWARTHRLAGWVFVLGGLAFIVEAIVGSSTIPFFCILVAIAAIPIAYSFYVYKRIEGFRPDGS